MEDRIHAGNGATDSQQWDPEVNYSQHSSNGLQSFWQPPARRRQPDDEAAMHRQAVAAAHKQQHDFYAYGEGHQQQHFQAQQQQQQQQQQHQHQHHHHQQQTQLQQQQMQHQQHQQQQRMAHQPSPQSRQHSSKGALHWPSRIGGIISNRHSGGPGGPGAGPCKLGYPSLAGGMYGMPPGAGRPELPHNPQQPPAPYNRIPGSMSADALASLSGLSLSDSGGSAMAQNGGGGGALPPPPGGAYAAPPIYAQDTFPGTFPGPQHRGGGSGMVPASASGLSAGGGGGGRGGGGGASNASSEAVSRVLIPNAKIGAVIGKGGAIVKHIRECSGARVTISDAGDDAGWVGGGGPGGGERLVHLVGSFGAVVAALGAILAHAETPSNGEPLPGLAQLVAGGLLSGEAAAAVDAAITVPPSAFRMLIPSAKAGALIGRGGTTIKAIRDASGARIEISSHLAGNLPAPPGGAGAAGPPTPAAIAVALSADRVVSVSGPFAACVRAHHLIVASMMEQGVMAMPPPIPISMSMPTPSGYVPGGSGGGGSGSMGSGYYSRYSGGIETLPMAGGTRGGGGGDGANMDYGDAKLPPAPVGRGDYYAAGGHDFDGAGAVPQRPGLRSEEGYAGGGGGGGGGAASLGSREFELFAGGAAGCAPRLPRGAQARSWAPMELPGGDLAQLDMDRDMLNLMNLSGAMSAEDRTRAATVPNDASSYASPPQQQSQQQQQRDQASPAAAAAAKDAQLSEYLANAHGSPRWGDASAGGGSGGGGSGGGGSGGGGSGGGDSDGGEADGDRRTDGASGDGSGGGDGGGDGSGDKAASDPPNAAEA